MKKKKPQGNQKRSFPVYKYSTYIRAGKQRRNVAGGHLTSRTAFLSALVRLGFSLPGSVYDWSTLKLMLHIIGWQARSVIFYISDRFGVSTLLFARFPTFQNFKVDGQELLVKSKKLYKCKVN